VLCVDEKSSVCGKVHIYSPNRFAGNFGASPLREICAQTEQAGDSGDMDGISRTYHVSGEGIVRSHRMPGGLSQVLMSKVKILIADDEPVASKILKIALQSFGYEVIVTSDGVEAWEAFDREPVRLIVSDWLMPGLDGLGLCKKVRERKNTLYAYLILLTSQTTNSQEIIPICAQCRKIRTDDNYWQTVEKYINEQTGSRFSHGICPECSKAW
jgi:sigma-B regulation protein RsbU (phosphoserine phosphatase)